MISVIIPTLNEIDSIAGTLRAVFALDAGLEVIVADGGSEDGTATLASSMGAKVVPIGAGPRDSARQGRTGGVREMSCGSSHADTSRPGRTRLHRTQRSATPASLEAISGCASTAKPAARAS